MNEDWQKLLPVLVYIQANLDGDLSLAALSQKAKLSPSHFHRSFKAVLGETLNHYVTRLRAERGAFRLLLHEARLLDIALDCGFQNHETFIRAFRRVFGKTPSEYRQWIRQHVSERNHQTRVASSQATSAFELSATKVVRLRSMHLAFLRHIGPYEAVPNTLFDDLEQWAVRQRVAGPRVWLGIGHDAPIATQAEHLRFDAALVVPDPFEPDGKVGYQQLAGGEFAVTTHAGSFETLPAAYAAIFPRVIALPGYQMIGLPAVEIYHSASVNTELRLNRTDIYLPVARCSTEVGVKKQMQQ
ncbi:MAG: AraC family transcriptional regulator [Acidobacteriota bacterium]|nr:AraC family transcriptional regulator [Acidobacteriota bacterium]